AHVAGIDLRSRRAAAVSYGRHGGRADPHVRIQHEVAAIGERQHEPLHQLDRELARVERLLHVVVLHVRDDPHVARILPERMTGELPGAWTLVVTFPRVLLRYTNGIQAKDVVRTAEPEDRLIPAGEPARAVEPVLEMPDDPIPQREPVSLEERVE